MAIEAAGTETEARPDAAHGREGPIGRRNVTWGWMSIFMGPATGSILMAWCFDGPFAAPLSWLSDYGSVERRMLRLAHIALVMIPLINIVFGRDIDRVDLSQRWKNRASWLCALAIPGVPLGLTLGALFWVPLKYLSVPGVACLVVALMLMAIGRLREVRRLAG